jgi:hypothetical protein
MKRVYSKVYRAVSGFIRWVIAGVISLTMAIPAIVTLTESV